MLQPEERHKCVWRLITSNVNQTHLCRLRFLTNSHNASEPSPIKNRQLQTFDWTRACVVNLASGVFLALQLLIGGTDVTVILLAQTIWGKKDHPTTRPSVCECVGNSSQNIQKTSSFLQMVSKWVCNFREVLYSCWACHLWAGTSERPSGAHEV